MEKVAWNFDPSVIIGTILLMAGYALAIGPYRRLGRRGPSVSRIRQAAFYGGCLFMFLALVGPLDTLGDDSLFSAHMAQHMLLTFVAPPLWVIGTPDWLIRKLVPAKLLKWLVNPMVAFLVFNGAVWGWHIPSFYDAALTHEWLHIVEHLMFMSFGVIGWLPVLKSGFDPQSSPIRRLIYLVPSMFSCTAMGAFITLSSNQLYPFYGHASLQWGLTPLGDQQLGGLSMWLPGDMFYAVLIMWVFKSLLDEPSLESQQVKI